MAATTSAAVSANAPAAAEQRVRQSTEALIAYYTAAGREAISQRLAELEEEWDIERVLERNLSAVSVAGAVLGLIAGKRFFILPIVAGGFLLQYALRGWCSPVTFLRRLGMRTRAEIDREKYALKVARGDFRDMPKADRNCRDQAQELLAAVSASAGDGE